MSPQRWHARRRCCAWTPTTWTLPRRRRADLGAGALAAAALASVPQALRTRVWRLLAVEAGVPAGALTAAHVAALDALVTSWRGQGPVWLPGGVAVTRSAGPDGSVVFLPPAAGVSP